MYFIKLHYIHYKRTNWLNRWNFRNELKNIHTIRDKSDLRTNKLWENTQYQIRVFSGQ